MQLKDCKVGDRVRIEVADLTHPNNGWETDKPLKAILTYLDDTESCARVAWDNKRFPHNLSHEAFKDTSSYPNLTSDLYLVKETVCTLLKSVAKNPFPTILTCIGAGMLLRQLIKPTVADGSDILVREVYEE